MRQRARRFRLGIGGLLALLAPVPPLGADEVLLANGRRLTGVIAREDGAVVRLTVEGGELTLSRAQVVAIERSESPLASFRVRRDALRARVASAEEWLELARWAVDHELTASAREAALEAAALEPRLAGLQAVLEPLGFVLASDPPRWLAREVWARAQGLVEVDGSWLTPERAAALAVLRERERARLVGALADEGRARAVAEGAASIPTEVAATSSGGDTVDDRGMLAGIPWWLVAAPSGVVPSPPPPPPSVVIVVPSPPLPPPPPPAPPATSVRTTATRPRG